MRVQAKHGELVTGLLFKQFSRTKNISRVAKIVLVKLPITCLG